VVEDAWSGAALEVEIAVVRDVADGLGIADGFIADGKGVVIRERIGDLHLEVSGKAARAVGADGCKTDAVMDDIRVKKMCVQTVRAAVDVVLFL